MIVFDLACGSGHRFEAWFRSGDAFDEQAAAGALACPLCRDTQIAKAPMAPRVARGSLGAPEPAGSGAAERDGAQGDRDAIGGAGGASAGAADKATPAPGGRPQPMPEALVQVLTQLRASIEATCEDVGPRFAEEARRIHFGETDERGIYGEASAEDAAALRDDGIVCQVLPWWQRRND